MMPADGRALVAIDLGAESCRVSLLRWLSGEPEITLVHRFANGPVQGSDGSLRWNLAGIEDGVLHGLRRAAEAAPEGIRAVAVDGWAVDYVRLAESETRVASEDPFCYRDLRTVAAETWLHERIAPTRMREIAGVQCQRINTVYQLVADRQAGLPRGAGWVQLPEYMLYRLGGRRVAEATNAAHCQLMTAEGEWSREIFEAAQLEPGDAPPLVMAGTIVGKVRGALAQLPAYADTQLIAPACHDTASAIAGIAAAGDDWAYISSGTWSLVGTPVREPVRDARATAFTNLAAAGGLTCFHANANGMWPLRQCMEEWAADPEGGGPWTIETLIAEAERMPAPAALLNLDEPGLLLKGGMMGRINAQLSCSGNATYPEGSAYAPSFASLIFHSLAARYGDALRQVAAFTGKRFRRVFVVGGGSRNAYLNRMIAERTGAEVHRGSAESSTLGNFAVQLATLEDQQEPTAEQVYRYATRLAGVTVGSGDP